MKLSTQKESDMVKIAIFYRCAPQKFNFFANTWNFLLKLGTRVVSRPNRQEILTKQLQFNPTRFSAGKTSTLDMSNFLNLKVFPTFLVTDSMDFNNQGILELVATRRTRQYGFYMAAANISIFDLCKIGYFANLPNFRPSQTPL